MSSYKHDVTPSVASEHLLGRVKWFNNKVGYGFITVTDGARSGTDVFVHHSAINVDSNQYKYLVQGEYVEFDLIKVESETHEYQASSVAGIRGGKLMCETRRDVMIARRDVKNARNEHKTPNTNDEPVVVPRQKNYQRKTSSPTDSHRDNDKKEWTLVGDKGKPKSKQPRSQVKTTKG
jgi:CspA family cold shock protein